MQCPFDDRQGLIQVDEHNSDIRQILRVFLLQTPIQNQKGETLAFFSPLEFRNKKLSKQFKDAF